jgi:hypothetical protein
MNTFHLSEYELQRLLDLSTGERENDNAFLHVRSCSVCEKRFRSLESIHGALLKQQLGSSDEMQIERVMARIRSGRTKSLFVPLLQRLVYLLAMLLVLAIIGFIFHQFDIIDFSELRAPAREATGIFWEYYNTMANRFASIGQSLTGAYDRIFGVDTIPVVSFTVLFLLLLAALDRWLLSPLLRRGR